MVLYSHRVVGIRVDKDLPYPPRKVWAGLTDSALLGDWLLPNDFEPRLHRPFRFFAQPSPRFDGTIRCRVLAIEPKRRLRWGWLVYDNETTVTFALKRIEGGTRLRFDHGGFSQWAIAERIQWDFEWRKAIKKRLPATLARASHALTVPRKPAMPVDPAP